MGRSARSFAARGSSRLKFFRVASASLGVPPEPRRGVIPRASGSQSVPQALRRHFQLQASARQAGAGTSSGGSSVIG